MKKIIDFTLREISNICSKRSTCADCPFLYHENESLFTGCYLDEYPGDLINVWKAYGEKAVEEEQWKKQKTSQ